MAAGLGLGVRFLSSFLAKNLLPGLAHGSAADFVCSVFRALAEQRSDKVPMLRIESQSALAAGLGLEPRYHAPEACVLPLDDPAMYIAIYRRMDFNSNYI